MSSAGRMRLEDSYPLYCRNSISPPGCFGKNGASFLKVWPPREEVDIIFYEAGMHERKGDQWMPAQHPCFEVEQRLEGVNRTPDLWSFKIVQQAPGYWLPGLPCTFIPEVMAPTTHLIATPHSVPDGCRQSSVPVAFLLFDQIGGCG